MKRKKIDCRLAVLELLCTGEPHSLGDLVRALRPEWSQSSIESQLHVLIAAEDIVKSTRIDFIRSDRVKVVTYKIA